MDPNIIVMALMDTQYLKLIVCFANRADPDVIAEQLDTIRTIQLILGSGKYNRAIGVPYFRVPLCLDCISLTLSSSE